MKQVFKLKNWCFLWALATLFIFFVSCSPKKGAMVSDYPENSEYATTEKTSKNTGDQIEPNNDKQSNLDLADMLQRIPGVSVSGTGQNALVRVRGVSSIYGSSEPLFVINGNPAGVGLSSVYSAINPNEVKSIRVLKGPDASIYGVRGANGVILISLK